MSIRPCVDDALSLLLPPILASPIARYGAPIDFEGELYWFTDLDFPSVMFVRYTVTLWVDVGVPRGLVPYRFVSIFVLEDGRPVGPIPYPNGGSSDDGDNG
ncbi:hypothetical protein NL676_032042 [Syzygium grande]|nr:hypothetical protein NL676_032042 [Syzygium grande]